MFYITCVSVFDGSVQVVFRSKCEATLRVKYDAMVARGRAVEFTTVKPTPVKQSLNVSILSY